MLAEVVECAGGLTLSRERGAAPDSASLRLAPVTPLDVPSTPAVEARTADGTLWRRLWVGADALVIDFTGIAVASVDRRSGLVTFDRDLPEGTEEHLLLDH